MPLDPDERRKERNRKAQRVFREKQKKKITEIDEDVKMLRERVRTARRQGASLSAIAYLVRNNLVMLGTNTLRAVS